MAEEKELLRSKHAFGSVEGVAQALADKKIDEFDILFLKDANGKPVMGWVDRDGNIVLLEDKSQVITCTELPEVGSADTIYIYNDDALVYVNGKYVSLCNALTEEQIAEKIDTKVASAKEEINAEINAINDKFDNFELVKYFVSSKPSGTRVDYRDKEVRIMCPSDTSWSLQNSGENADKNCYYIGFKAYAPEGAVSFKEDLAKVISDETMYYFEGNEFAGIETDGRKYSIIWLPVARYNAESDSWTYYGNNSTEDKYIGWYYSVEWYDENEKIIDSDCIRINLANEACYSALKPFYAMSVVETAKEYTDQQIDLKIAEAVKIVEF